MKSLEISCTGDVIEMWLQRCHLLLDAHSNAVTLYRALHYVFGISVIVLSGIMTVPSVQHLIPYFSSTIVVIASIYVFLGFNDMAERHRRAAKSYGEVMRSLEAEKGCASLDTGVLASIEERIDRVNAEAPEIPLYIFRNREKLMLKYVADIESEKKKVFPSLVKNVAFASYPSIMPSQFTQDHYRLETEHFGKYAACPPTFDKFKEKYEGKSLILTEARLERRLIGYCIFEEIGDGLCHLSIIVVSLAYRGQGVGRRLVTAACEQLAVQGFRQFSLFTAAEPTIARLFRGVADPVSVESDLTSDELHAIQCIARHRGLGESEYGSRRKIDKYYTLRDGSALDASFRLYRL